MPRDVRGQEIRVGATVAVHLSGGISPEGTMMIGQVEALEPHHVKVRVTRTDVVRRLGRNVAVLPREPVLQRGRMETERCTL